MKVLLENMAALFLGAFLVQNLILNSALGLAQIPGGRHRLIEMAKRGFWIVAFAVAFNILTFLLDRFFLVPLKIEFLRLFLGMVVLACFYDLLERRLALPANNLVAAFLAIALLSREFQYNLLQAFFFALGSGSGIALVLLLLAGFEERFELADVPKRWEGVPILWISLGILGLAFLGFQGLLKGFNI
jgi:electron transport complex protein RnfA